MMSNIRIGFRLLIITAFGTMGLILFAVISLSDVRSVMLNERKAKTRAEVETVLTMVKGMAQDAEKSGLSQKEAQDRAMAAVRAMRYSGDQYFWITDQEGVVQMNPVNAKVMGTSVLVMKDAYGNQVFKGMLDEVPKSGGGFYIYDWTNPNDPTPRTKVAYVGWVPEWHWVIGTGVYIDDVNTVFWQQAFELGGVGTVILVISAVLALVVAHGVVKPLDGATRQIHQLANGELNFSVAGCDRKDEIGEIARALEIFKENATQVASLRRQQEDVAVRTAAERKAVLERMADRFQAEVMNVVDVVAASSVDMNDIAALMSQGAEEAATRAASVAAAAEEATSNVETVASAAEQLSASTAEIARQVTGAADASAAAFQEATETNVMVGELAAAADRIGQAVHLIRSIASQTNMLALNATIEAARAGETGKGFAVVAGEVKGLATQTASATEEINSQVAAIQQETRRTVQAIAKISGVIDQIREISTSIASAIQEQDSATREIARNVEQAALGTRLVSGGIGAVSQLASSTGEAATRLLTATRNLGDNSANLHTEVVRFVSSVRSD